MSERVGFGTAYFQAKRFAMSVDMAAVRGVTVLNDLSGGITRAAGGIAQREDWNKYVLSEGLQTRFPGALTLPYLLRVQTSITSDADISGYLAANKRAHAAISSLGTTPLGIYIGLGPKFYRTVSATDHALEVEESWTDEITSLGEMVANSTRYLAFATTGATQDWRGTQDPTAGSISWDTIKALSGGDRIDAFQYFPELGATIATGQIGGVSARLWYLPDNVSLDTTPSQVVDFASKDVEGSLSTTSTSAIVPITVSAQLGSGSSGGNNWAALNEVLTDDTTGGTHAMGATIGNTTDRLTIGFASTVPRGTIITGVTVTAVCKESNADGGIFCSECYLVVDGEAVGINLSDGYTELSDSFSNLVMGSTTNRAGLSRLTGAQVQNFGIRLQFFTNTANNREVAVDYVSVVLTYRMPGAVILTRHGGFSNGSSSATVFAHCMPDVNNSTGITSPRRLHLYQLSKDANGAISASVTVPDTGMNNVHHYAPYLGGYVLTGSYRVSPALAGGGGVSLKHLGADGKVRNFGMPAGFPSTTTTNFQYIINKIEVRGDWLILDVGLGNNINDTYTHTEAQTWYYHDGNFYGDCPLLSLSGATSGTTTAMPVAWGTSIVSSVNSRHYSISPNSTDTQVARIYIPPDLAQDPRVLDDDEVKQMAFVLGTENLALSTKGVEMDDGPETQKAIYRIEYQGRMISAASGADYGSVTFDLDLNPAYGTFYSQYTADVTNAFVAAYTDYEVPIATQAYRTFRPRWRLTHDAGSIDTPSGLPIVLKTVKKQKRRDALSVEFTYDDKPREEGGSEEDALAFIQKLDTADATQITRHLRFGNQDRLAVWDGAVIPHGLVVPGDQKLPVQDDSKARDIVLRFKLVDGTI